MSNRLSEEIIKHVLSCFGVVSNDVDKTGLSLNSKDYQLKETILFDTDEGLVKNKVWGTQFIVEQKMFKVILADTSIDKCREYCLLVHLEGLPYYSLYLSADEELSQALIAFSMDGSSWNACSTFLQATFLAAMEQIREGLFLQILCEDYKKEYQSLLDFLKFHGAMFEETYEG